jgi:hypothetical protein
MTLATSSGSLPHHQYVYVDTSFISREAGWTRAVWFGLNSHPGRAWGLHVLLESGAIYRSLPPHAVAFAPDADPWTIQQAQRWDCYGRQFSLLIYDYLYSLDGVARVGSGEEVPVSYLFTAVPIGDAYTDAPEQGKEFLFLRTDRGRLTIQPTDKMLFREASFTAPGAGWPTHLRRQTEVWSVE